MLLFFEKNSDLFFLPIFLKIFNMKYPLKKY